MIPVMLFNATNVIVWGLLAWHFDKWWLMFYALLFIQTYKEEIKTKHTDDKERDKE